MHFNYRFYNLTNKNKIKEPNDSNVIILINYSTAITLDEAFYEKCRRAK
jgi:hypothetical protein